MDKTARETGAGSRMSDDGDMIVLSLCPCTGKRRAGRGLRVEMSRREIRTREYIFIKTEHYTEEPTE